ncbi:MAG: conjugal transfer protein TraR [Clostridiales bacterium]|jgi:YteA family regulatory protein|nr:conjugal transfer protein TraR [Clostridiales bacterium]
MRMKNYELNYFKEKLLSEMKATQEVLKSNKNFIEDSNLKEDLGELSSYDNHPADTASEVFEQEKSYSLEKHSSKHLADIQESLKKIEDGSYGICDYCGHNIGFDRLDAQPIAKLCINCQKNHEVAPHNWDKDRPVEEDVLSYPFGRTFMDDSDNVVYDGEDAWQDVQQYGSSSGPQDISTNRFINYGNAYYDSQENIGFTERVETIDNQDYNEQIPGEDTEKDNKNK